MPSEAAPAIRPIVFLVYVQDMGGRDVVIDSRRVEDGRIDPLSDQDSGPATADWFLYLSTEPIRDKWIGAIRSGQLTSGTLHRTRKYLCSKAA